MTAQTTTSRSPSRPTAPAVGRVLFYPDAVPARTDFRVLAHDDAYVALPDGWVIALTDVVASTEAIARGRYRQVNLAGAALIAAAANRLGGPNAFPFVFAGDGAALAAPGDAAEAMGDVLARTSAFARDELGLTLRAALVPLEAIRAAGHDVRVARHDLGDGAFFAMFAGGGLHFAEERMKAGDPAFCIDPGPAGQWPDLTHLSCRFDPMPSQKGSVLSVVVQPAPGASAEAFAALVDELVALVEAGGGCSPIPAEGPVPPLLPQGLATEAAAALGGPARGPAGLIHRVGHAAGTIAKMAMLRAMLLGRVPLATGYVTDMARMSDFRKYADGLYMTVDATQGLADSLTARLTEAENAGLARFGVHAQARALMTCFVPSLEPGHHLHFVDGAGGGYAAAARQLRERLMPRPAAA